MRWDCPHCRAQLETPHLAASPGPRPGWSFGRCMSCQGFAAVEHATARAQAIGAQASAPPAQSIATATPVAITSPGAATPPASTPPASIPRVSIPSASAPPPFRAPERPAEPMIQGELYVMSAPTPAPPRVPLSFESTCEETPGSDTAPSFAHAYGPARSPFRRLAIPGTLAAAGLIALVGGAFHYIESLQAPKPANLARSRAAAKKLAVRQAMPRVGSSTPTQVSANPPTPQSPQTSSGAIAAAPAPMPTVAAAPIQNDSIRSAAMAPIRPTGEEMQLYLMAKKGVKSLELRTGPGHEFPLFGLADLDERYPVLEWKNRWFRIQLEETPGLTAWAQYERIELFSEDRPEAETDRPARFFADKGGRK